MTTLTETITDEPLDSIGEDCGLDTVLANYHEEQGMFVQGTPYGVTDS